MKSCGNCRERDVCARLCPEVEARLPKDYTGKDPRMEISLDTPDICSVVEMHSYALWCGEETSSRHPVLDLSALTHKERSALRLLAQGMSMRAAARRLKINLNALQCRVASARRKLSAGQSAHLVKGGDAPSRKARGGGR